MKLLIDSCVEMDFSMQLNKKHSVIHMNKVWAEAPDEFVYAYSKKKKAILITSNYKDFENLGRFVLKNHAGCIVLHNISPLKMKFYINRLFNLFSNKTDYFEKRIIVKKTKIGILSIKGKKEIFSI